MGVPVPGVDRHVVVSGNTGGPQLGGGLVHVVDEETDDPTVSARPVGGANGEGRPVGEGEEVMPGALDWHRPEPEYIANQGGHAFPSVGGRAHEGEPSDPHRVAPPALAAWAQP